MLAAKLRSEIGYWHRDLSNGEEKSSAECPRGLVFGCK